MKKLFLFIATGLCLAAGGCKKYLDVNTDPNNPVDVQPSLILAPVELNISDNLYGGNASTIIQNLVQGIAANQPNPGLWNYQLYNNTTDGDWALVYTTCLQNLKNMIEKADKTGSYNYSAVGKILFAYTLAYATDIWGNIPYSQAFRGSSKFTPVYDSQEDIYKTIQGLLSGAIADIGKNSTVLPQGDDYFYGGAMAKWKKLAWVLKARYFMHLSKAPGYTASIQADSVLAALAGGMVANSDDLDFSYTGAAGSENSWNLAFSPVSTYVLNATFVDTLKARSDPRLPKMVSPAAGTGLYTGRKIGTVTASLDSYSYPADFYGSVTASNHLVSYSEALFLKAEAVYIKSGAVAALPVYTSAIKSHCAKLGLDTTSAAVLTYIASRPLTTANALQRIMEEKGVANFLNFETYNDWRRTGYPALTPVTGALSAIPRRMLYPESEILTNPQAQQSALATDKVWWDK
jgi:hypothetical protein